ncbi:PorT family protein [Prevotella sp. oral taxon 475]|uniref:type IX secretion/gliding motility protein PorT/SprT n=1 Tax=Prevotella sp. oral taxon 475 TaxID=712471 RepID=UPI001BAC5E07|nr:porin family protein [Prevotella sp. oral taxon 475]QUB46805.1 PorT family protein [Prevotella sp. oral taxon 475]
MKKVASILFCLLIITGTTVAQERKVENRPYTDLRPFHFGVVVGAHVQDVELMNVGPQPFTREDGTVVTTHIAADQDRYDLGFTVGVLGEFRLSRHFQFRIAPAMYFGNRHLVFKNLLETNAAGQPIEQRQDLKTAYLSSALNLIFAAPRFNNHRPYVTVGLNPMLNLSGSDQAILRFKRHDFFAEVGIGCDFYLPYFKLRPELKFMFSLIDCLDPRHADRQKDRNLVPYSRSVRQATGKMIALSFYFE